MCTYNNNCGGCNDYPCKKIIKTQTNEYKAESLTDIKTYLTCNFVKFGDKFRVVENGKLYVYMNGKVFELTETKTEITL